PVVVPAAVHAGDPGGARFHEPPRQQHALAPAIAAVLIAQTRVFTVDVERLARRWTGDEVVRLLREAVHRLHRAVLIEVPPIGVETLRQRASIFEVAD